MNPLETTDELRRGLGVFLQAEKARAKAVGERPRWTAASLGNALGNKDHVRDFLVGNKETLSAAAIVTLHALIENDGGNFPLLAELRHEIAHGFPRRRLKPASFDPDAPDNTPDPDAEPSGDQFPPDAIKELAAKPGMGSGQTVETSYVRYGDQIVQRDAILDDYWRLPPDFVRGDLKTSVANLLVVNCRGDSMEPTLRAGDRLVVDTSDVKPSGDRIFAIRDQLGEIVVKRLRLIGQDPIRIQIVSDNPTVENFEAAFEDVPIVGRVVAGLKLF